MANEFLVGIKIGAAVSGTFQAAFASVGNTVKQLNRVTDDLRNRQTRLGTVMAKAMSHPLRNIGELKKQYDSLGKSIDALTQRQERLIARMARGKALSEQRKELRGQAMETIGTGFALGAPMAKSVMVAADFEEQLRDIRINANLDAAQEANIGKAIREAATDGAQTYGAVAGGVNELMKGGITNHQAESYAGLMSRTMTALKADSATASGAMLAFHDMGISDRDGMQRSLDRLVYIGQQGQFTPQMMVQAFAELGDTIKEAGLNGEKSIGELAAGLQVAEEAMGADGARAGQASWLQSMANPTRIAMAYASAGVDYSASMAKLHSQGLSEYEASIELANAFIRDKLSTRDQQALLAGDRDGRVLAMLQQMGLGEVFRDPNAARYALTIGRNKDRYNELANIGEDRTAGSLEKVFDLRKDTFQQSLNVFKNELTDVGITVGTVLLPTLTDLMKTVKPVITEFGKWASANPGIVKGIAGITAGLLAGKLGMIGLKYGINLILSPLNAMKTIMELGGTRFTLLKTLMTGGIGTFTKLGMQIRTVGQALLWVGRAAFMNPIGLAIAGIAIAGLLVYKYWEPIKGFFQGLWGDLKNIFSGSIGAVSALIRDWSPAGLFYSAFAGVMKWFGVDLPNDFVSFGKMLIDGLVSGIMSFVSRPVNAVRQMGQATIEAFRNVLGIHSPSRVFAEFGDNLAIGTALGLTRSSKVARRAAIDMAGETSAAAGNRLQADRTSDNGRSGHVTIQFSPVFHIQGDAPPQLRQQIDKAMTLSLHELERMIDRVMAQKAWRAF